jgi:hypothetical protein
VLARSHEAQRPAGRGCRWGDHFTEQQRWEPARVMCPRGSGHGRDAGAGPSAGETGGPSPIRTSTHRARSVARVPSAVHEPVAYRTASTASIDLPVDRWSGEEDGLVPAGDAQTPAAMIPPQWGRLVARRTPGRGEFTDRAYNHHERSHGRLFLRRVQVVPATGVIDTVATCAPRLGEHVPVTSRADHRASRGGLQQPAPECPRRQETT